jgi:hypothetical protein
MIGHIFLTSYLKESSGLSGTMSALFCVTTESFGRAGTSIHADDITDPNLRLYGGDVESVWSRVLLHDGDQAIGAAPAGVDYGSGNRPSK